MSDEEIKQIIQELSEGIAQLSDPEKPLTKEEKRRRSIMLLKIETLQKIQGARERGDRTQELSHSMTYGMITTFGEKHPFLMHLLKAKFWLPI